MKPIIQWAGGKRRILKKLNEQLPRTFNRYFEPFVGGGALLFKPLIGLSIQRYIDI